MWYDEHMKHLYFIHGFLGLPTDWSCVEDVFDCKVTFVDLSRDYLPKNGFESFAKQINQQVNPKEENYLVGYSLGGRLALHALIDNSSLWKGAMIISAHPGLENEESKNQRLIMDASWALRFLAQDWDSLIKKWNDQPVFLSSLIPERFEQNYNREILCDMITYWSLAQQENLSDSIAKLSTLIYWVVGEKDDKFVTISNKLSFKNEDSKVMIMKDAGHRLPWDNPTAFIQALKELLDKK